MNVVETLLRLTGKRPRVVVAFSGGVDSTALAHALSKHRRKFSSLRLVHVDHGLQAASSDWAKTCARQARAWRLPFTALRADARRKRGDSPEATAREARYAALGSILGAGEVLVTAQHLNDQSETVLLQLFRGAGPAGLSAMPAIAPFGDGMLARPLLGVTREAIEDYARRHRLRWIEDPTNAHTDYMRNFLRNSVLPAIRSRWSHADVAIVRAARHVADVEALVGEGAMKDWRRVADGAGVSVAGLRTLPDARRRHALRAWIAGSGVEAPSTAQMAQISGRLLSARADANPSVAWPRAVIRRRAGRLELEIKSAASSPGVRDLISKSWRWTQERACTLNSAGDTLSLIDDVAGPIDLDRLPRSLEIRARAGGEALRPGPRARTRALKKLVQSAKMSVETRERLPLAFSGKGAKSRLLFAGDRWIDASVMANDKSLRRARLQWSRK